MPAPIDEIVKRKVVQQWLAGEAREKITSDNDIGAGTVSLIVDDYKAGLDSFDLDSFRELTLEAKKRGMSPSNLASFLDCTISSGVLGQRKMRLSHSLPILILATFPRVKQLSL
jgi:hypothetical protein